MADLHLLADVGGTNTRVGLADHRGLRPDSTRSYANAGFAGLAPLLAAYLDAVQPGPIAALCAGVAGPVRTGGAQLTNLDWFIASDDLRTATGAGQVHLINDLQAQACALDDLPDSAVVPILPGQPQPDGARLVLGLGTGCNVAVAHRVGDRLFVPAAESGHTGLPHGDARLNALTDHLAQTHPHKPIEAALSGPGLLRLHRWLGGTASDTRQIIHNHADGTDAAASETLRVFTHLLGTVAGDLCLHHMATGGLYLIGGTARAIAPYLAVSDFPEFFAAKGPYSAILRDIPVTLIADDTAALRGCARYLAQLRPE